MSGEDHFVIKNHFELKESMSFRVGGPNKLNDKYDPAPEVMLERLLRVFSKGSKSDLKGFGIGDAVKVWLSSPTGDVDPKARIHWGSDGMGLMVPPPAKFPLGVLQEAAALGDYICFAYLMDGDLPVVISGTPRFVDSERRLVLLDSPGIPHPRNFLVDEIIGFYEKAPHDLVSWCFKLEPLSRKRLKVTMTLEEGFPREAHRRRGGRSESAQKEPTAAPGAWGRRILSAAETVEPGELIEVVTDDGRVLGLRVEYERIDSKRVTVQGGLK